MYARRGTPTDAELAKVGLTREDIADDEEQDTLVWPEHWPVVTLFDDLGTQWRSGMNGYTGLDYAVLPALFELHEIPLSERKQRFGEIRTMERAALEAMRENRK